MKQVVSLVVGVALGLLGVTGWLGFLSFFSIVSMAAMAYVKGYIGNEDIDIGDIVGEGFAGSLGWFVAGWVVAYST